MKEKYYAPVLEVEHFETVVMGLVNGSDPGNAGGIVEEEDDLG